MICPQEYRARVGMFNTRRVRRRGASPLPREKSTYPSITTRIKMLVIAMNTRSALLLPLLLMLILQSLVSGLCQGRDGDTCSYLTPSSPCLMSSFLRETFLPSAPNLLSMLLILAGIETNPGPTQETIYRFLSTAQAGDLETVRSLLRQDPNLVRATGGGDQTALIQAALLGHTAIVKVLVGQGADLEKKDINGFTALHAGPQEGNTDIVKILVEKGADMEKKTTPQGNTALLLSVKGGHTETVKFLLTHSANVSARSKDGVTPLLVAAQRGYSAICHLLLSHGSQVEERHPGTKHTVKNDTFLAGYYPSQ